LIKDLLVIDCGSQFGLGVGQVFTPWDSTVVRPRGLNELEKVINASKDKAKLLVFGGGSDIHPSLYQHENVATHASNAPSYRDRSEVEIWKIAQENKIPILGICRGAQLACALSGGALIQHTNGHAGSDHAILTIDNKSIMMSTAHHQMMYPDDTEHILIAWHKSQYGKNAYSYDQRKLQLPKTFYLREPEIVYYQKTQALAVQGHPEFMDCKSDGCSYVRDLVAKYLFQA
jgi:GMP synthase-like glutamine amidotransferase